MIAQRPETIELDMLWDAVSTGVATATCLGLDQADAVQKGVDRLRHPMRGERVGGLLMDAAHNEAAVSALAQQITGPVDALVSLCGRDPVVLAPFIPVARQIFIVEAEHPKAVSGSKMQETLSELGASTRVLSRQEAIDLMKRATERTDLALVAFGSIYGLGPLRDQLMGVVK